MVDALTNGDETRAHNAIQTHLDSIQHTFLRA
ncbi:hypothetical protein [Rhodococcus pseudokoreensis]